MPGGWPPGCIWPHGLSDSQDDEIVSSNIARVETHRNIKLRHLKFGLLWV